MSAARPLPELEAIQKKIVDKRFAEALDDLEVRLARSPDDPDALYMSAVCHRYRKEYEQALSVLDRLKGIQPENGRAHQEEGHTFRDMGRSDEALAAYVRACRFNPALEASWRQQLEIHATRGHEERAGVFHGRSSRSSTSSRRAS